MPRRPRRAQLLALTLPMFESPILSTEPRQVLHGRRRRIAGPDDRAVGASREVSAAGYSRRRMGTDTSQHSCRLALAQQARQARPPLALTRPIGYPRRRMGTSARHPSRRLAVARRAMRLPRSAAKRSPRWSIGLTQANHWSHDPAGTMNAGFNALEPTGHWDRIDGLRAVESLPRA